MIILASLAAILGFTGVILTSVSTTRHILTRIGYIVIGIFCVISILLCVGLFMLDTQEWKCAEKPYKVEHIVSLTDNTQTSGQIFLKHGYMEDDMYYQYMVKHKDGRCLYNKVKEKNATVYVSDSNYRVESYKRQKHWLWFADEDILYRIYVPEWCIQEGHNLDSEG